MNQLGEETNIIELKFPRERRNTDLEEEFEWCDEELDDLNLDFDPLNDLLTEFDHINLEDLQQTADYIHHLEMVTEDSKLDMKDSPLVMSEKVEGKINRINEGFKRLKYYLDEMNIED